MVRLATHNPERQAKAELPLAKQPSSRTNDHDLRFSLTHALQTSLELEQVLEIFFSGVKEFLTLDGLGYDFTSSIKHSNHISLGEQAQHTANYRLTTESSSLGALTFRRHKPFLESELAVLEMLIGILHHPLKNALNYKEAVALSMRDPLTGAGNRQAMNASFDRELKLAKRQSHAFSVLLVDLDHFKEVNDKFGHSSGDLSLQHVVNVMRETLRDTDQIFRFGGEEFLILLNQTSTAEAKRIAERVRANIGQTPVNLSESQLTCTVSIGTSAFSGHESPEILFERADRALYHAKENGRDRVSTWEELQERTQRES